MQSRPQPDPDRASDRTWDRLQEEAPDWLKNKITDLVRNRDWAGTFMGKNWRDTLADLAKYAGEERSQVSNLVDRARGLNRFLPKASNYLPKNLIPRSPEARLPTLPRLDFLSGRLVRRACRPCRRPAPERWSWDWSFSACWR